MKVIILLLSLTFIAWCYTDILQKEPEPEANTSIFSINEKGIEFEMDWMGMSIDENGIKYKLWDEKVSLWQEGINMKLDNSTITDVFHEFQKTQNINLDTNNTNVSITEDEIQAELQITLWKLETIAQEYNLSDERTEELRQEVIQRTLQKGL